MNKKNIVLLSLSAIIGFSMFPSTTHAKPKTPTTEIVRDISVDETLERKLEVRAKEVMETRSESSPLTKDNKEEIVGYYAELYIPTEGCSLLEELPKDSDINYVKPKPKVIVEVEAELEAKVVETPTTTKTPQASPTVTPPESKSTTETSEPVKVTGNAIGMTDDERHWLEKLIEAEAADEPYEGKVAVATTIANRVESKSFPNTIMEVIKQNNGTWHQYSPWDDGAIHKRTPSADTISAIQKVFDEGNRNLPKETVYFAVKGIAFDNWMGRTRQHITTIHNHAFFSEYAK